MSLNYGTTISALKAWVFQNDPSQLTWEMLRELRLEKIAAPLLRERVPAEYREPCLLKAKEIGILDVMQYGELCRVEKLFEENSIRYCPFKGADLARRVWSNSALRTRCDLDLLVHPEDCRRAVELLKKDGWETPFQFSNEHHEAPMRRHDVTLELHSSMHNLESVKLEDAWSKFVQVSPCHFQFPLELNLLMLFAHSRDHKWLNGIQLLLDCGFLVKKEGVPDWARLREFAEYFGTAMPTLLFRAFPDFFPPESMPEETFPEDVVTMFRKVICTAPVDVEQRNEMVMSTADRYSFRWWMERSRGMRPSVIRILTNNPKGHYFRLFTGYCHVFRMKVLAFWQYRHGTEDSGITSRLDLETKIEQICREQEEKNSR